MRSDAFGSTRMTRSDIFGCCCCRCVHVLSSESRQCSRPKAAEATTHSFNVCQSLNNFVNYSIRVYGSQKLNQQLNVTQREISVTARSRSRSKS